MDSVRYYYLNSGTVDNEYGLSERNNNLSIIHIFEQRPYEQSFRHECGPGSVRSSI